MEVQNAYTETLVAWLGEEGQAVASWISNNTTNEEFYEQPLNVHQPERLLIDHAVGMLDKMIRFDKVLNSVRKEGKWEHNSPYSQEDIARVALYHILGNINKFRKEKRNKKDENGKWYEALVWNYNEERLTYGTDAEQALLVVQAILRECRLPALKREVEVAILNIAGVWDNPMRGGMYPAIYKDNQLALLAHLADTADNFIKCKEQEAV